MTIHVVRAGETLYAIARRYGVSPTLLAQQNQLPPDGALVPGQALVVLFPRQTHTVAAGESLFGIGRRYGVTVNQLYRNNYFLLGQPNLRPGQELMIALSAPEGPPLTVAGYAYPFIRQEVLSQQLPYLSRLMPFTYGFTEAGRLLTLDDAPLLAAAGRYGVEPWLHLSTLTEAGNFSTALGERVLRDDQVRERLTADLQCAMTEKGYRGLDVDFEFLGGALADSYAAFIANLEGQLEPLGYPVMVALAPKTYADQPGALYEGHDYAALSRAADQVLLMTYEWGYTYGPPMAVAPLPQVRQVLSYALTVMPPEKILLGVPTYGYDWPLPYVRGVTRAQSLSPQQALDLARQYGAEIQFDEGAQAPFFRYRRDGELHEVWFEDARSAQAKLSLAAENRLLGVGLWNLMRLFPQFYLLLHAQFSIAGQT